jgi:hypothetical protein
MIRKLAYVGFIGAFACAFTGTFIAKAADDALPKAETILDHYVEVTGGKAAYESRKTEVATGTVEFAAQGLKGTLTRYAAAPDKSYSIIELEGIGKMEQGTVNGMAWDKNPMITPRIKSGVEKAQGIREGMFNGPLNWRKVYAKAETVGVENAEGEECYKVTLTPFEGKPETGFFSKKSGLEIKRIITVASPMGEMQAEAVAQDYKDFGGVLQPTKMLQRVAGQELVITIQSVKINEQLPADRFDPPAEIQALMKKPAQ